MITRLVGSTSTIYCRADAQPRAPVQVRRSGAVGSQPSCRPNRSQVPSRPRPARRAPLPAPPAARRSPPTSATAWSAASASRRRASSCAPARPSAPPRPHRRRRRRPASLPAGAQPGRNSNTVSLLAGVGVLLLALGVGVLIGRSGASSKQSPAPVQVVTAGGVGHRLEHRSKPSPATGRAARSGYTVQLQTLPVTGTTVASVAAAKAAAGGKGAAAVGALKAEEFASLSRRRLRDLLGRLPQAGRSPEGARHAEEELPGREGDPGLRKRHRVDLAAASGGSGSGGASNSSGGEQQRRRAALQTGARRVPLSGHEASGKKFEEESAKLPDVVSTG